MDAETREIKVQVLAATFTRAIAFNHARNGAFSNTIGSLIETGIDAELFSGPTLLAERFNKHLIDIMLGLAPDKET